MFNKIKSFLTILWTGIYTTKFASAETIAQANIIAYAEASGLRVAGSPLFYLRSKRVAKVEGKKISILAFDVPAMVKDGFYLILDCGGFGVFIGDVIVYDINNEKELSQNDFGFFLNHEIGHLVHGDAWSIWKSLLLGRVDQNEGLYIDQSQEIEADQYAKSKGFKCPDLLGYLRSFYSRCGLPNDYIEETLQTVKEIHKDRFAALAD